MRRQFVYTVKKIAPDTMEVSVSDMTGKALKKAPMVIIDPKVMSIAATIIHSPMEELAYGLYGEKVSKPMLKAIIRDVIEQATSQA